MSNYETSDYTDFSSISDINSKWNKQNTKNSNADQKRSSVWEYFDQQGTQKHEHIGCVCKGCGWQRKVEKAYEMVKYLVLLYFKVLGDVKNIFLQELRE